MTENKKVDKLILIAGAGRNVGKTTLMCLLIKKLKNQHNVTAVKVSSHHHKINDKQKLIYQSEGLKISEEQDNLSSKDSARYIRAGANKSLFVQLIDKKMPDLITWLKKNVDGLILCESGIMGQFITPSKAIFVDSENPIKKPKWDFPYAKTIMEKNVFKPGIEELLL